MSTVLPPRGAPAGGVAARGAGAGSRGVDRRWVLPAVWASVTVAVVAQQFGRVFDDAGGALGAVAVALVVGAAVAPVSRRGLAVPLVVIAIGSLAGAAVVFGVAGGRAADLPSALIDGVGDALGAVWPAPVLASSLAAFAALSGVASGVAVLCAVRWRSPAAILASLALLGLVALLSAPAGVPRWTFVAVYGVAIVATLRSVSDDRGSPFATAYLGVAVLGALLVPLVIAPAFDRGRYDPRERRSAVEDVTAAAVPLARLAEWRSIEPAVEMFRASVPDPTRWRLVALTRYDGRSWLPADDYRPSGGALDVAIDGVPVVAIDVTISALDSLWLPAVGHPVAVSQPVKVDGGRGGLLPAASPSPGDRYRLDTQLSQPQPAQLATVERRSSPTVAVDGFEIPSSVRELASVVTSGATNDFERASRLAQYLATEYGLDPTTPSGHSITELEVFLSRTRLGGDEQFVASYGLLAASIGLPVRVVVGFDTVPDLAGGGTVATSDRVATWPEVEFGSYGWVRFDPLPAVVSDGGTSAGQGGIAPIDDVVAPTPTTTPPAIDAPRPDDEGVEEIVSTSSGLPAAVVVPAVSVLVVLAAIGSYVGAVLWWKARRRRRRQAVADPAASALAAFATGVDHLVDLGARAHPSSTDREVVLAATSVARSSAVLAPVAEVATAVVFDPAEPSAATADHAWRGVDRLEEATAAELGRWRLLRARVSLRSVRRPPRG